MNQSLPTMIVAAGVYEYFREEEIVAMIRSMKAAFPGGELIFDATNSAGLKYTNWYVRRTGNRDARMYFGLDDPAAFALKCGTKLLSVEGFFQDALKLGRKLSLKTRVFMYFADRWKRAMIVHLKFQT